MAGALARGRSWRKLILSKTAAQSLLVPRACAYSEESLRSLGLLENRKISVALDGARMGQRDTLYHVAYSAHSNQIAWLPQIRPESKQVRGPLFLLPICRFSVCRFKDYFADLKIISPILADLKIISPF